MCKIWKMLLLFFLNPGAQKTNNNSNSLQQNIQNVFAEVANANADLVTYWQSLQIGIYWNTNVVQDSSKTS